jgi:hypothetical protein
MYINNLSRLMVSTVITLMEGQSKTIGLVVVDLVEVGSELFELFVVGPVGVDWGWLYCVSGCNSCVSSCNGSI